MSSISASVHKAELVKDCFADKEQVLSFGSCSPISSKTLSSTREGLPGPGLYSRLNQFCATVPGLFILISLAAALSLYPFFL